VLTAPTSALLPPETVSRCLARASSSAMIVPNARSGKVLDDLSRGYLPLSAHIEEFVAGGEVDDLDAFVVGAAALAWKLSDCVAAVRRDAVIRNLFFRGMETDCGCPRSSRSLDSRA
jgi:hypothetical protein